MNKARLLVAAALAISLALPAGTATAATEQPTPPGGVALTWAPTYMSTDLSYSASEAVALAKSVDLVAGMPVSFKNYVSAMRQANPRLTLLSYANATFLDGSGGGVPESEFAHDSSGRRIRSGNFGNYLMEPSNSGWRNRAINVCTTRANGAGYDGCLLDMLTMGIFSPHYVSALPERPGGGVYTESQWRDQLISLIHAYRTQDPSQIYVGNAASNSRRYWRTDVTSRPIVMALPGAQMEDFLRGSADGATSFPPESEWLDSVNAIKDMESQGVTGLFSTKLWSSATQAQVAQWQKYSMATFLMGANGHSYFAFTRSRDKAGATGTNAPYRMPKQIGNPTSAMYMDGASYVRDFGNGKSVVNPSDSTDTVQLGRSYHRLDGSSTSSVTLPPHSGEVLVGDGSATSSSSTATPSALSVADPQTTTTNPSAPHSSITSPASGTVRAGAVHFTGTAADPDGIRRVKLAVLNRDTGRWLEAGDKWGRYASLTATFAGSTSTRWDETLTLPPGDYWVGLIVTDINGVLNNRPRPGVSLTVR